MIEQPTDEQEPAPDPLPVPDDALTGRVIVVFGEAVLPGDAEDLGRLAEQNGDLLTRLVRFLREAGVTRTGRVVRRAAVPDLERAEERARSSAFPPRRSLTRYWWFDTEGTDLDPERAAEAVRALDPDRRVVVDAYSEGRVAPACSTTTTVPAAVVLDAQSSQGWLRPAPVGVDAFVAWDLPGGRGAGVRVIDVEAGWDFDHPDLAGLPGLATVLVAGTNPYPAQPGEGDHGTSVLGLVTGRPNAVAGGGVAGEAWVGAASHHDGTQDLLLVEAIAAARARLGPGDVLVLEVHLPKSGYLCVETDDAVFDAIRLASAEGVVVVEAAGNGDRDLDGWRGTDGRFLARQPQEAYSGAIVVGACREGVLTGAAADGTVVEGHSRNWKERSNYGVRVDVHAWGEAVQAPVAGGGHADFAATSAATAIVAGVVAAAQGLQRAAGGVPIDGPRMRDVLRTGSTPQIPVTSPWPIGGMPDLAAVAAQIPVI